MSRREQWLWTIYLCAVLWVCWWSILTSVTPYYYKAPTAEPYVEYKFPESRECEIAMKAELSQRQHREAKIYFGDY
jgi:hypothetical protein